MPAAAYTASLIGPDGTYRRIDILSVDMAHARALARDHGKALFGRRAFTFSVRREPA